MAGGCRSRSPTWCEPGDIVYVVFRTTKKAKAELISVSAETSQLLLLYIYYENVILQHFTTKTIVLALNDIVQTKTSTKNTK